LKLKYAAIIATILVIIAGGVLISPLFLRHEPGSPELNPPKPRIVIIVSIVPGLNVSDWCQELGSVLNAHQIGASVFFTGSVAEQYPQCLACFGKRVDIGSQTYSNSDLTKITDYSLKLEEVMGGKKAVDAVGELDSRIFRAPFGSTDQDIYSLLSRSGILADFSYMQHYNVYYQNKFLEFAAAGFVGHDKTPDISVLLAASGKPNLVFFDNTRPVSDVEEFLSQLDLSQFAFVNVSELIGPALIGEGGKNGGSQFTSN
jgi:peptidoglycan/xylan/chitin deacetylase (PgdA/CDA1 family)